MSKDKLIAAMRQRLTEIEPEIFGLQSERFDIEYFLRRHDFVQAPPVVKKELPKTVEVIRIEPVKKKRGRPSKYTDEQKINLLLQVDALHAQGENIKPACKKAGITDFDYYTWRSIFKDKIELRKKEGTDKLQTPAAGKYKLTEKGKEIISNTIPVPSLTESEKKQARSFKAYDDDAPRKPWNEKVPGVQYVEV